MTKELAPRGGFEPPTFRLTAEVVEILNALSCVAYGETRPIFSPSVGLLGLPAIDSVTPAGQLGRRYSGSHKLRMPFPGVVSPSSADYLLAGFHPAVDAIHY